VGCSGEDERREKWTVHVGGVGKHHVSSTKLRSNAIYLNSGHTGYQRHSNWHIVTSSVDSFW